MQPRVTLFGEPSICLAGRHEGLSRRAARVATWLIWHSEPVSSIGLLNVLFAETPAARRATRHDADVRNGLYELRKAFVGVGAPGCLLTERGEHSLQGVRSDLIDVRDAVELGHWDDVGYVTAAPFLETRGRGEQREALRDESWAAPLCRLVDIWRGTTAEVYERVSARTFDERCSLASMLAQADVDQRLVVALRG